MQYRKMQKNATPTEKSKCPFPSLLCTPKFTPWLLFCVWISEGAKCFCLHFFSVSPCTHLDANFQRLKFKQGGNRYAWQKWKVFILPVASSELHTALLVQSENRETFLLSMVRVILAWELFRGCGKELFRGHKLKQKTEMTWPLTDCCCRLGVGLCVTLLDTRPLVAEPHGQGENGGLGRLWLTLKNTSLGCGSWSGGLVIAEAKRRVGQEVGRLWRRVAGARRASMRGEVAMEWSKREARWPGGVAGRRRRSHTKQGGREVRQARGKVGMRQEQRETRQLRGGAEARTHCEGMPPWDTARQSQVRCSQRKTRVPPPTAPGERLGRQDTGENRQEEEAARKEGRWGGRGAGRKVGSLRREGRHPGPLACPVGGRPRVAALRPPQRDARKSPLDCGSRREGLRESQPGSEWQRGKRRPPPPPPPLLLSRGRAAPPAHGGVREAARRPGQPRAHAAAGRPGTGLGARRGAGAPGARRRHFGSPHPSPAVPSSFPLPARVFGVKNCRRCWAMAWDSPCARRWPWPRWAGGRREAVQGRPSQVAGEPGGRGWGLSPGQRPVSESSPRCPQAAPGQEAACSANLTELSVAGQSVRLRWSAAGRACNFSLSGRSEDGEAAGCQPAPEGNRTFGCTLRHLEAGTWYHLRIEPLPAGEPLNISLQTGTGRCAGLFLSLPLLRPAPRGGGRCIYSYCKRTVFAEHSPALEFCLAYCQK